MEYNHSVSNLAWEKVRPTPHVPDLAIALRVTARFARQGYGLGRLSARAVRQVKALTEVSNIKM